MLVKIVSKNNSVLLFSSLAFALISCSADQGLSPFNSDACSLFPDNSLINEDDWCACCFHHDIAYWKGGSEEDRIFADKSLKQCVLDKTGNEALAHIMYEGVRFGGSPYFYNWYRWGYGWSFERKYQSLSEHEEKQAEILLTKYYSEVENPTCNN